MQRPGDETALGDFREACMTAGRRSLAAEPSRARRGHQTIVGADREIIVQGQQHARARQQALDQRDRFEADPRQMVKVHHVRAEGVQQFSHCRHERPRLGVAEHEAIERAHPQQHFVGAAADGWNRVPGRDGRCSGLTQPRNMA